MSGTRVIYHLEHQETPYLLHVPAQHVTLADLKQVLNKQNHKFFFKSVDDDFGVVKEEIRDDDAQLPSVDGRVVCWLVSSEDGRVRPTPHRTGGIGDSRPPSFHGQAEDVQRAAGGDAAQGRSEAPPAGESRPHPLDSEPSSEEDSAERFSRSSSSAKVVRRQRGRHRREKTPHMEKSESLSSLTDSSMSLTVVTVTLDMEKHRFLGISIVGQSSERGHGGVCVGSIMKGGAAAADARVEPGDMLLQVNDVSLENTSNEEAVRILREALRQPSPLTLTVAKCWGASPAGGFSLPRSEPVRPIDPAAWVSHTAAMSGRLLPHYSVHEDVRLTVHSDMEAVVRSMADPESGVDVRDRLWLKITIPHAFIGSDVVDWLLRSVDGFVDRRDARKYAATLLSSGYIRHAVNKLAFSEQCYYVFGNACTDASSTHHEEVSCHSGVPSLAAAAAAWEGAAERGDSAPSSGSSCSNNQPAGGRAGGKPRQEADAANGEDATPPPTFSSVPQQPFRLAVGKSGDCSVDVM
ncbi:segment polarity protein dishevelled homolog DVL-3-like isoform X2 [Synchiropus splendidus]|uniref:segment polarity protein dishevelled homolog DVL-3-like isoform X2 n=1 Tax=Synchiropus splendidus TaxID=270530 RepID=UPI00237E3E31|nr:segment polarity protein dishevelled homolog DVL-3-like isoform X2 [Synchiropus splendidus]